MAERERERERERGGEKNKYKKKKVVGAHNGSGYLVKKVKKSKCWPRLDGQ